MQICSQTTNDQAAKPPNYQRGAAEQNDPNDTSEAQPSGTTNDQRNTVPHLLEHELTCPYCWERITMVIEPTDELQEYVEDCEVCCNPILIGFARDDEGGLDFSAQRTE